MLWRTGWVGGREVANECHLSSTFSLNNLLSVCHMACIHLLAPFFGQMLRMQVRAHAYRHGSTRSHSPLCCVKASPLGWIGIISSRWFMMENAFSRTTWVTSFSRPENKYRPPCCILAWNCADLASRLWILHSSFRSTSGSSSSSLPLIHSWHLHALVFCKANKFLSSEVR